MHRAAAMVVLMSLGCARAKPDQGGFARVATLLAYGGTVDVLRGGAVDWAQLAASDPLYEEDRLRTFQRAWAQLAFVGGSALRVEEESLISLGGGVTVERGVVFGELQAGLKLRTRAVEAESARPRDIVFR